MRTGIQARSLLLRLSEAKEPTHFYAFSAPSSPEYKRVQLPLATFSPATVGATDPLMPIFDRQFALNCLSFKDQWSKRDQERDGNWVQVERHTNGRQLMSFGAFNWMAMEHLSAPAVISKPLVSSMFALFVVLSFCSLSFPVSQAPLVIIYRTVVVSFVGKRTEQHLPLNRIVELSSEMIS